MCDGRDDMHEEITSRFCRGHEEIGHLNSFAAIEEIQAKTRRIPFETCLSNAYRVAHSNISYKESLLLTDSDSDSDWSSDCSSDCDLSEYDRKYRRRERRRRGESDGKRSGSTRGGRQEDPLEMTLKELKKLKAELLEKKMDEVRELASEVKLAPTNLPILHLQFLSMSRHWVMVYTNLTAPNRI